MIDVEDRQMISNMPTIGDPKRKAKSNRTTIFPLCKKFNCIMQQHTFGIKESMGYTIFKKS